MTLVKQQTNDLKNFLNQRNDGVIFLKEPFTEANDCKVTFCNPAMAKVTGLNSKDSNFLTQKVFKLIMAEIPNEDEGLEHNLSDSID